MTEDEILKEIEINDLEGTIFKALARSILPEENWSERELKMLTKLGLNSWFSLGEFSEKEDEIEKEDEDFFDIKNKDDFL